MVRLVLYTPRDLTVIDYDFLVCRYFVRVTISRRMADVVKEKDIWVHSFRMPPDSNNSIKMEVGIEDCLHIEFEYNKSKCVPNCLRLAIPF
jgi:hypothetical protein